MLLDRIVKCLILCDRSRTKDKMRKLEEDGESDVTSYYRRAIFNPGNTYKTMDPTLPKMETASMTEEQVRSSHPHPSRDRGHHSRDRHHNDRQV